METSALFASIVAVSTLDDFLLELAHKILPRRLLVGEVVDRAKVGDDLRSDAFESLHSSRLHCTCFVLPK